MAVAARHVHRKPIGESGTVRVTRGADGQTTIEWLKLEYPPEKKDQEEAIARAFTQSMNGTEEPKWELRPLDEDDFDFEISRGADKRYVELQEIVISGKKRGPPYATGEQVIEPA